MGRLSGNRESFPLGGGGVIELALASPLVVARRYRFSSDYGGKRQLVLVWFMMWGVRPLVSCPALPPTPIFRLIIAIWALYDRILTICAYELRSGTDGGGTRRN